MPNHYSAGTRVQFNFRGEKKTGIVIRTRIMKRKGKAQLLAMRVTGDPHSLDRTVVEIAGEGDKKVVYTVGVEDVLVVIDHQTKEAAQQASEVKREIQWSHQKVENERRSRNIGTLDGNGLWDVNIGDDIQVKFRDIGWVTVKFAGFVQGSLNVRFTYHGRTSTISPEYARTIPVPATPAGE